MTAVTAPRPVLAGRGGPEASRPNLVLAVCCSAVFMVGLDITMVNVGLPQIGQGLHATVSGLQWTVAGYTVVLASLVLSAGSAADRVGRRTVFQVGLAVITLASWLCSLAPSLSWLIAFRVLQGVGGSMLNPAALGIITSSFREPARRARAIGVWGGVIGLAMALGPVAGGALIAVAGWRAVFWANIPVGLAAIALTSLVVPESRAPGRARRPDPAGQVLVTVMLASLTFAIIQGPSWGWRSAAVVGCFALSAVTLRELVGHELRRRDPLIELGLFRRPSFSAASLAGVCVIAAQGGFLFLMTIYLQDVRGYAALRAGLAVLPMPAAQALFSPLSGRVVARKGPLAPLAVAGIALALSAAALSRAAATASPLFLAVVSAVFGAATGLANSPVTYGVMSGVPQAQAGVASGLNSASRQLGQSLGVAVAGSVLTAALSHGMRSGYLSAAPAGWIAVAGWGLAVALLSPAVAAGTRRGEHGLAAGKKPPP